MSESTLDVSRVAVPIRNFSFIDYVVALKESCGGPMRFRFRNDCGEFVVSTPRRPDICDDRKLVFAGYLTEYSYWADDKLGTQVLRTRNDPVDISYDLISQNGQMYGAMLDFS